MEWLTNARRETKARLSQNFVGTLVLRCVQNVKVLFLICQLSHEAVTMTLDLEPIFKKYSLYMDKNLLLKYVAVALDISSVVLFSQARF